MEEVGGAYLVFGFFGSCMNKEKEVEKKNKRVAERERKGFHLGLERERREKREEREKKGAVITKPTFWVQYFCDCKDELALVGSFSFSFSFFFFSLLLWQA